MKVNIALTALLLLSLFANNLDAQETRFFMPEEIRQAYDNGARAYDGKPGPKYWQNTADYTINVAVDVKNQRLNGEETVTYFNNSPNKLNTLIVRLYNDVYRENSARLDELSKEDITEGVELSEVAINGLSIDVSTLQDGRQRSNTLLRLPLKEPLAAGASLELRVRWSTQLPKARIRAGVSDSTSFFVGYWYPQIAVYDDVFGWDRLPYNLQSEFYNGLANFDVTITAPENFLVWATGELQNAAAVYPPAVLERFQRAKVEEKPIMIVSANDLKAGYRNPGGSWHYKASEVTDFAFAVSDHYMWEAAALPLGERKVLINSIYPARRAKDCEKLTSDQQKIMKVFSENFPGIPYPYPVFTTFVGNFGGGMEFPMMANNGSPGYSLAAHEMYHTYFPMYVRTNEKRFAWMDEGWASYCTSVLMKRYVRGNNEPVFSEGRSSLRGNAGSLSDLPLITSTQFMDGGNYGYASYPLPAFVYGMLHHHLGDDLFLKCYQEYIRRWAKKSPTPYDFFYTFENVSGQDLGWLWKPWFFEYGYADLAVKSLKGNKLTIEKRGSRPVPVHVLVQYKNGDTKHLYASASVWQKKPEYKMTIDNAADVEQVQVNPDIPDQTELDNFYPTPASMFAKFPVPPSLTGPYRMQEFPADVTLEWRDGLLFLQTSERNISAYLLPKSEGVLRSLDGQMTVEYPTTENPISGITIKTGRFTMTAKRF